MVVNNWLELPADELVADCGWCAGWDWEGCCKLGWKMDEGWSIRYIWRR